MVGVGEGDDEAALVVHQAVHRDAALFELGRGEHGDQLVQEVGRGLEKVGKSVPHGLIQSI